MIRTDKKETQLKREQEGGEVEKNGSQQTLGT